MIRWWESWAGPCLIGVYVILALALTFRRHATFQTSLFDLGYYTQVLWNTSQGRWFASSLKPPTYLGDHFSPVLALLVPLFSVAPDARTLLAVEAIALAVAIIPAYLLLRARHPALAPLLVLAFVLNPLLHQTALEEFHEIMLAAPVLALAVYALHTRRNRLLLVALGLALLVREDVGLFVASFGLYLLVRGRRQRWQGLLLIGVSVAWFVGLTKLVIPALGDGTYHHGGVLESYGASVPEAVSVLAQEPFQWVDLAFALAKVKALARVLGPLAALPLLAAGTQLLWAPSLLLFLFSPLSDASVLRGWMMAPLLPLLWGSIAVTLAGLRPRLATLGIGVLLLASLVGFRVWSPFPGGRHFDPAAYRLTPHIRTGHRILAMIPADVSVAAQGGLGAHLAAREQLYLFPWFDLQAPPDVFVLDSASSNSYPLTAEESAAALLAWQMAPETQLLWEEDGYFVLRTTPAPTFPRRGPWVWAPWLQLEGYELAQADGVGAFQAGAVVPEPGRTLRVDLYWRALAEMETNYSISVRLVGPSGQLVAQNDAWPARGALPTTDWAAGRTIRDSHYLQLPSDALPQPLSLAVVVYETTTVQPLPPVSGHVLETLAPTR